MSLSHTRNFTLDLMRTFAIVLMVIFHFLYDLKLFGWVSWDTPDGFGWQQFRWVIITLFFLALGISLTFAHQHNIDYPNFMKRLAKITASALIISIVTFIFIRENWIFFGVLHFLALASVLCLPFVKMPRTSFVIGTGFMLLGASGWFISRWPFHLLFTDLPLYTNDYVAIVPWLGMVFFGIALGHNAWFKADPMQHLTQHRYSKYAALPGQHGLLIYLLHQPILIGSLYLISLML
ncbi:heparan-alpha-glucosaminide N-acetyltransferase [Glaciecola sp. SC05]|uniref:heparan-alpha-glucosaminide N-acetyltransferase n=1 Tax=Glaciecola sp. SC05 TaxID=1987355 RepID=UPI0035283E03